MSIADQITRIKDNISNAYDACNEKGATLPTTQNSANLAATITSIKAGGTGTIDITTNGMHDVSSYASANVNVEPELQEKTTTTNGEIIPDDGYYGLSKVTVNVSGGSSDFVGITREVTSNGVFGFPIENFTFTLPSNAKDMSTDALNNAFDNCSSLTSVDLSSLSMISGFQSLLSAFSGCSNLTSLNLSNLSTISGISALNNAFYECTSLTSVDLLNLSTISGNSALRSAFRNCTNLTSLNLSNLSTISGISALDYTFSGCTSLTSVDLSNLSTISGDRALNYAFSGCTNLTSLNLSNLSTISGIKDLNNAFYECTSLKELSFPALTSSSFEQRVDAFESMLSGVTGCTVHFPSNLESVIGSWSDVTSGFGGSNTTVLFDLPATE